MVPRVLLIAHHFPPIGGSVGRNLATALRLPEHGYEPLVLTGGADPGVHWAPRDEPRAGALGDLEIHRVPGPVPPARRGLRERLARRLERPEPIARWWTRGVLDTGRSLGPVDVVLANLIPYETAFSAAALARELGVPWVADLEDPWALDEMRVAPTAFNHRIDRSRMRRGLRSAAALIMNCDEAAARMRAELPAARVSAIPHGYEPADFAELLPARDDGAFRIVHTGTLHTRHGLDHRASAAARRRLRGTSLDVDILPRSHVHLLEAVDRLRASAPGRRIEVHLAGGLDDADRAVIGRRTYVHAHGHLTHAESIALMRTADLLFLPMHALPPGRRAGLVPCKTYEYLASGRPILAAVPDGDARDLLARFARATVVRPGDVDVIARGIAARLHQPAPAASDEPELARYRRGHQVGQIARVLDEVMAGG